ncbi:MAG: MBL fold metallo-hydrolase RNA specificity domain-containing protein [Candidatus Gracilibacteria bacterium]
MNKNHTTNLTFLGAVGTVTPSSTILTHTFHKRTIKIMVDAGITPGSRERIIIPTGIDMLLLSHGHVDHVGQLPRFWMQNPESKIYIPEGNKEIIAHNVTQSYRLSMEENPEAKMGRWLNEARGLLNDVQVNIPKRGVIRSKSGDRHTTSKSRRELQTEVSLREAKLESAILSLCMFLQIPEREIGHMDNEAMIVFFRRKMQETYGNMLDHFKNRGIVTKCDVDRSLAALCELSREKWHTVMKIDTKNVRIRFDETGHIVTGPGCAIGIDLPTPAGSKKIGFTGDVGNPQLGYPGTNPDFRKIYNLYDVGISEATYGDKHHADRSDELRKLDSKIMKAVREKTDIVVITLALERSVYSLYEILQCLKNNNVDLNALDISYFGDSIADVFKFFPKGKIKDTVRPFLKPLVPNGLTRSGKQNFLQKLGLPGKKQRLIIASCGFFAPGGPSAHLLAHMYSQEKLLIISANYHGEPGSNGYNLFHGEPYQIDTEMYDPKPGHETFAAGGFSGHADVAGLTRFIRKTIKDNGTVFLNHGSDAAREALARTLLADSVLISKKVNVFLPKANRAYKANQ